MGVGCPFSPAWPHRASVLSLCMARLVTNTALLEPIGVGRFSVLNYPPTWARMLGVLGMTRDWTLGQSLPGERWN